MGVFHNDVLEEILERRVSSSRGCRNPRGVKRKMSNYPIRRNTKKLKIWNNISEIVQVLK